MIKGSKYKAIIYNRLTNFFCSAMNIDQKHPTSFLVVQYQGSINKR